MSISSYNPVLNLDDSVLERNFPYIASMAACIQDPIYHAEGDVWTHTQAVMAQCTDRIGRLTALYHDVAKPATRTETYDPAQNRMVVRHPHHAKKGAAIAWFDLWQADEPLAQRLAVFWLCRWHQRVFHLWNYADMTRAAWEFSSLGCWSRLLAFARADTIGRICLTAQQTLDDLDLLAEWLGENHINPDHWQTDQDRLFYFEKAGRSPLFQAQPPVGSRVIVLSGLPGVGKDSHIKTALADRPMVSLDAIRKDLRIAPDAAQGRVVQAAFEQARVLLRDRRPFVWNAQCVTRLARDKIIGLCRAYDAHVTVHAFDRPLATILRQNATRPHPVPENVIIAAAHRWEPPSLIEAHRVIWV